jgi:sugar phosphate isomerase/epimerase
MATMPRRNVLRAGLAAGAWAAAHPSLLRAAEPVPAKAAFHFGTVTYMVGAKMDLPTLIDTCEKAGLEGVELRTTHKHGVEPSLDAAGRAKVKEAFAKTKVRLVALGTACEFHDPKPEVVKKNVELTKEFVALAADVGAWGVKVRPNGLPKGVPVEQTLKQIGEAVAECGAFAQTKGIVIAVEMHGGGTSDPPAMAKIMEACKHPSVGLCWNSNGGDVKEKSIRANFDLCKSWIRHCHVRSLLASDYPWKELFDLLKGIGYAGYTMLESDTKGDPVEFLKAQRAAWEQLTA